MQSRKHFHRWEKKISININFFFFFSYLIRKKPIAKKKKFCYDQFHSGKTLVIFRNPQSAFVWKKKIAPPSGFEPRQKSLAQTIVIFRFLSKADRRRDKNHHLCIFLVDLVILFSLVLYSLAKGGRRVKYYYIDSSRMKHFGWLTK